MHPHLKHWHLIDYIILRKKDRQDIWMTSRMCSAECWTDHCHTVSKLSLCIQPKRCPQGKKAPNQLNIAKLKSFNAKLLFDNTWEVHLESTPLDSWNVETDWMTPGQLVYTTVTEILGPSVRKHKDWFDENCSDIRQLIDEKHNLYKNTSVI